MLHTLGINTFHRVIRYGSQLGFHCFQYEDKSEKVIIVTPSRRRMIIWWILSVVLFVYCFFIFYRLYESVVTKGVPLEKCTIHVVMASAYWYYFISNVTTIRKPNEVAEFLTNFHNFDARITPLKSQELESKAFGKKIHILSILCFGAGILHMPVFLALPNNPNYVFSVIQPYLHPSVAFIVKYLLGFGEMWVAVSAWTGGSVVHAFTFCIVPNCIYMWTCVMKYDIKWRQLPMKRATYYRIVQLLMVQFNDCYAYNAFLATTVSAFFGVLICTFVTLRYYGRMPLMAYLLFPCVASLVTLFVFLVYPNAGRASESHTEMVKQWQYILSHQKNHVQMGSTVVSTASIPKKSRNLHDQVGDGSWSRVMVKSYSKRKYNLAFFKSCRPIGFWVGGFFSVEIGTAFTFWEMVLDQLINFLIYF